MKLDGRLGNSSVTLSKKFRRDKEIKETWRATPLRELSNFRATGKFFSHLFRRIILRPLTLLSGRLRT
jgi:hypothetical protein